MPSLTDNPGIHQALQHKPLSSVLVPLRGKHRLTIVYGQTGLVFAHNVVPLLLLHVGALVVRLVKDELIGASPTLESVDALRVFVRARRKCDGQAVAAVWTDYQKYISGPNSD